MVFEVALGVNAATGLSAAVIGEATVANSGDLLRGAIGGAFIIGAAFLAGIAVFRRNSAAVCALLMVLAAAALEFTWLGLFKVPSSKIMVLMQGAFGASILIYLSSTLRAAKRNALLGGLIFAGALTMIGLGVINFLGRVEAGGLMLRALFAVGGLSVLLAILQSMRGDHGARLLLPGAVIALAAPFTGHLYGAEALSMTPHALFTFGILAASLVALTEGGGVVGAAAMDYPDLQPASLASDAAHLPEQKMLVSENQLAEVLDYSGVAVWDWSEDSSHQTESFATLFDAQEIVRVTPRRLRDFVHPSDRARFEHDVFGRHQGDGAFDITLKLRNETCVRLRGARAVDDNGDLERLVVFAEMAPDAAPKLWDATPALAGAAGAAVATLQQATAHGASDAEENTGNIEPAPVAGPGKVGLALEKGQLEAAFQPIVSLEDQSVQGYEALLRATDDAEDLKPLSTEEIVSTAEAEGKGGDLASMMLKASSAFLVGKMKARKQKDLFVAFNVSFAQLRGGGFVEAVTDEIKSLSLPAKSLVIELTESEAVSDDETTKDIFARLKAAGAALAFDDFGAGFSSLSNLHKFSFDYLKVDKSFIEKLGQDEDAEKIVSALAELGAKLGMIVIAEGLSSKELIASALKNGCRYGQGYALGQPELVQGGKADAAAFLKTQPQKEEEKDEKKSFLQLKLEQKMKAHAEKTEQQEAALADIEEDKKPPKKRFWSTDLR